MIVVYMPGRKSDMSRPIWNNHRVAYLPIQLQQCDLCSSAHVSLYRVLIMHTISSLHIGHTILELAAAAAWPEPCSSRATLDAMSSFSVDIGVLDA